MDEVWYVPIFKWGISDDNVHGSAHGLQLYKDLSMLYAYEEDAVGHIELRGKVPTKKEFDTRDTSNEYWSS